MLPKEVEASIKGIKPDDYAVKLERIENGKLPITDVIFTPYPKQALFMSMKQKIVLYGGSAGPGKSTALIHQAISLCMQNNNYSAIIFRRKIDDIVDTLVDKARSFYMQYWNTPGLMEYNEQKRILVFPQTGSKIKFDHLQNEKKTHYDHKSAEYDYIGFDELTQFEENQFFYMFTRCRSTKGYKAMIRAGSNPDGIGNNWVKNFFVKRNFSKIHREAFSSIGLDIEDEVEFIPASVYDNPFIMENDPSYIAMLKMQDYETQRSLLYGEWELSGGRHFKEFRRDIHVIPYFDPREQEDLVIATGTDDGFDPSAHCTLFGAKDHNGNIFIFDEHYAKKNYATQNISVIKEKVRDLKVRAHVADTEMWTRDQKKINAYSVADLYRQEGIPLEKATKARGIGWKLIKDLLYFEVKDGKTYVAPKLYICENCTNLISHIMESETDQVNPDDIRKIFGHDTMDALRYLVMYLAPERIKQPKRVSDMVSNTLKNFISSTSRFSRV